MLCMAWIYHRIFKTVHCSEERSERTCVPWNQKNGSSTNFSCDIGTILISILIINSVPCIHGAMCTHVKLSFEMLE